MTGVTSHQDDLENVVTKASAAVFHKLYGVKKPKVTYYARDFLDYVLMIVLSAIVLSLSYGYRHVMSIVGLVLCASMLVTFIRRHGVELRIPVIFRQPQEILYTLVYKLQNLSGIYFLALGLLVLENVLITVTPNLPHKVEWTHKAALYLFYASFIGITAYRTAILICHLANKELVREVLMQTPWSRTINEKTNITLEIVHAYSTGVLTHIILIAPWFIVITYSRFSLIFLPVVCALDIVIYLKWVKVFNAWFYRDHWLGHNSEFQFIFLHGTHHDAVPSGLIAVAENGLLEGFTRFAIGAPTPFLSPLIAFVAYTFDIKSDIELHQYIPGVFPRIPRKSMQIFQHSTHHYGQLEPYSIAMKLDQPCVSEDEKQAFHWMPDELKNSIRLDEELTGFRWDNPTQQRTLRLFDKYQK
jgi:hypothetical protein